MVVDRLLLAETILAWRQPDKGHNCKSEEVLVERQFATLIDTELPVNYELELFGTERAPLAPL